MLNTCEDRQSRTDVCISAAAQFQLDLDEVVAIIK